jgi:hypothetical protein
MGYQAINRRPWVVGIPAGLSAYLWLDPPLALAELAGSLRAGIRSAAHLASTEAAAQEPLVQQVLLSGARLLIRWLNLVPLHVPAGLVAAPGSDSGLRLVAAVVVANLAALLLSGLFLTLLGGAVGGERVAPLDALRQALRVAWRIALYLLAVLGVGLIMGLPFLAISAIVVATLPNALVPVLAAWYVALFWAYVYTGFAPEAILISRVGPLRAIYHSVNVVRRNLLATLGLLLVSFLIISGLGVVWRQIGDSPGGVAAAILGSAYVGSGLSAARLQFYRERLALWRAR